MLNPIIAMLLAREKMLKLDFRIEWGYRFQDSPRLDHPQYVWDGHLNCFNGSIESLFIYHYPRSISGPVSEPKEIPLQGNSWQETNQREFSGLHVIAETGPDAVFRLETASGSFEFSARQILEQGKIVFNVGPEYGNCQISVIRTGFL